ncbi:multiheme c-type cytochrome [Zavarzinella formosa]|uniref:multiheme c-type cytochrome n=1 Tax=Zavarzinella formosa TaxID=360055 RepID=UPI00030BC852|nr:multiheme c-type cytochrome [Zavarzinella formosa]
MTARLLRLGLLTLLTAGGGCFAILITSEPARTQEPKKEAGATKVRDSLSVIQCVGCHGIEEGSLAYQEYAKRDWGGTKAKVTQFVKLNEFVTWSKQDMHSQAFRRINPVDPEDGKPNPIAAKMQENLKYDITKQAACLACHSLDLTPEAPIPDKHFNTDYGVSCESCHGPANDWNGLHVQAEWRGWTPAQKAAKGMIDLRDPAKRTEVCVSCHIGNVKEGKFVTHEMYAAGHPPLPAFELVTFCRDEPGHYHQPKNEAIEKLDPKAAFERYHYRPMDSECADARNLAAGSVGTMKAFADLLADSASKAGPNDVLDFALFDCYACHHELKIPSFRQDRGYRGVPGRPSLPAWPGEGTRVLLKSLDADASFAKIKAEYDQSTAALQKAIDARPFGIPAEVAKTARPLGDACGKLQADLAKLPFDTARTEQLYTAWLDFVKNTPKDKAPGPDGLFLDYFTAQQTGWSIRVLQDGLRGRPGLKVTLPPSETAEARQKALGMAVSLELRTSKTDNKQPSAELFNARMKQLGNFDLPPFLDAMTEFVKPGGK